MPIVAWTQVAKAYKSQEMWPGAIASHLRESDDDLIEYLFLGQGKIATLIHLSYDLS